MKAARIFSMMFFAFLVLFWMEASYAGQKVVTIPKGTKMEKPAPGIYRFLLPDKSVIELRNFNPKTGAAGYVKIINPDPPDKPIEGTQGILSLNKMTQQQALKLPPSDYIRIDDDIAWLPISLTFQLTGIIDPDPPDKPRNLSPQPDPPGKR